ncbi:MAG: hypothetical protein WC748_05505 [Legionellales bacterium]|jgi:hypothetical protein
MSQLESETKPILLSLMADTPIILNQDEVLILAQWITLKVIVAEHDGGDYVVTPNEQRKEFKSSLTIPPNFNIWLAKFDDGNEGVAYVRETNTCRILSADTSLNELNNNLLTVTLGQESRNIQIVTFSVGKIIVHVRHSTLANFDFESPHSAIQLYPITASFSWPPPQRLSRIEAGRLARLLTETI